MRNFTIILSLFLLTITTAVTGQTNSWINYSQKYVRVGVSVKGLQKVTFSQLNTAGLDVNTGNANQLQLFHRGNEVSIISTDNNEVIFYGELNDGASDSLLFRPYSSRMNPYYSMYSDEGAYFFTLGSGNGKRAETINQPIDNNLTPVPWHWERSLKTIKTEYSNATNRTTPSLMQSYFRNQETFTSAAIATRVETFTITNRFISSPISSKLTVMVNGRDNYSNSAVLNVGASLRKIHDFQLTGFVGSTFTYSSIEQSDFNGQNLSVQVVKTSGSISLTYLLLEYPQLFNMANAASKFFQLPESDDSWSRLTISQSPIGNKYVLDVTDINNLKQFTYVNSGGNEIQTMISRSTDKKLNLFISNTINDITKVRSVNFQNINPTNYNYLIITNNVLKSESIKYGTYRASIAGGSYNSLVMDILDIYDQFNYGEPSPIAIHHFARHMLSDNNYNKYLFLIGHAISYPSRIKRELIGTHLNDPAYLNLNEIPTIGYPGSDALLVDGLAADKKINVPGIPVGRIPATLPSHVADYLDKVVAYEASNSKWNKNVLHITGGGKNGPGEITILKNTLENLTPHVRNGFLGGNVTSISKDPNNFLINDVLDISSHINNGVGMVTFYGHGGADKIDYDFGYLSDSLSKFQNNYKTPFFYFNGCGVNNIFSGRYDTTPNAIFRIANSTDWLFSKKKGAIAVLANSYDSYLSISNRYLSHVYNLMFNEEEILTIGEIQRNVAIRITNEANNDYDVANLHQSLLQGDPALKLIRLEHPEYILDPIKSLFLSSGNPNITLGESTNIKIGLVLNNEGKFEQGRILNTSVKLTYRDNSNSTSIVQIPTVAIADSIYIPFLSAETGRTMAISDVVRIDVIVNHTNNPFELNTSNNSAYLTVNWNSAQNQSIWNNDDAALPVTLTYFDVVKESSNAAHLKWSTTEEFNSAGFEIQRSSNGKLWKKIGYIVSKHNSNQIQNYSLVDEFPLNGENLYRIKMIDIDSTYEYSNIKSIQFDIQEDLYLWPNPTLDFFTINASSAINIRNVTIRSVSGLTVDEFEFHQPIIDKVDIRHLPAGIYFITITDSNDNITKHKVVKN